MAAQKKKEARGGTREGAGRPRDDARGAVVPVNVGLRQDQLVWLRRQAKKQGTSVSALLRDDLDARITAAQRARVRKR